MGTLTAARVGIAVAGAEVKVRLKTLGRVSASRDSIESALHARVTGGRRQSVPFKRLSRRSSKFLRSSDWLFIKFV